MDSCARGAFLSGLAFRVSPKWLQAASVSNSAVATQQIRVGRRCAYFNSMCIRLLLVAKAVETIFGRKCVDITTGQKKPRIYVIKINCREDLQSGRDSERTREGCFMLYLQECPCTRSKGLRMHTAGAPARRIQPLSDIWQPATAHIFER